MNEERIYAVVSETVQTAKGTIIQPPGRQIAQVAHAVSKLRYKMGVLGGFVRITTIVLQARDSNELSHVQMLLLKKKHVVSSFFDRNDKVYGDTETPMTALAVYTTRQKIAGILDYLPLWGTR